MRQHHFYHGDFGWIAHWEDVENIWWDEDGDDEPTERDADMAQEYWEREGWSAAMEDIQNDKADHQYEMMLDDR
jgi:hypothetical protein